MSELTPSDIAKSIVPNSDQLNADDLITGPVDVVVTGVTKGNKEQPWNIHIDGGRHPYKPCKSMRRVILAVWGDQPKTWVGHAMRLYCDPDVKFGGAKVGGIRISHMSGIETRQAFMLTVTRSKRVEHVIEPMEVPTKELTVGERLRDLKAKAATVSGVLSEWDAFAVWAGEQTGLTDMDLTAFKQWTHEQVDALEKIVEGFANAS